MIALLRPTKDIENQPLQLLRKRYVQALSLISALCISLGFFAIFVLAEGQLGADTIVPSMILIALNLIALLLITNNRFFISSLILIVATLFGLFGFELDAHLLIPFGCLALITGAVLANQTTYLLINLVVAVRLGLLALPIFNTGEPVELIAVWELVVTTLTLVLISAVVRFVVNAADNTARNSTRSAELLQATAELGQILSKMLSREQLLTRAVEMIRDRFAFYHVQVFLIDEKHEYANLVASTGEVGQRLIARKHRLAIGSQSVIGRVTQVGEPVISRDTDTDNVHAVNELLPNTRSELALPISDGERIIGALDVQSTRRNAFVETDVQALQIMANQLATAIRNASLFEEKETSIQENKRLFLEAEAGLREIQRLNSQMTSNVWGGYLNEQAEVNAITLEDGTSQFIAEWSDAMREAQRRQRPISHGEGVQRTVAVPITLRGAVLGAIEVTAEDVREADVIEMMQAVAQRLATNLDNVRLYEEAQESAQQEQRINAVVARYQSANSIDELLQITLAELSETLGAEHSVIRLGVSPERSDNGNNIPFTSNGSGHHD